MRKDLDDNELIRMQQEAIHRVQEMQKRARLTFEESQSTQKPLAHPPPPLNIYPAERGNILPILIALLLPSGKGDPILAAALAYLDTK